MTRAMQRLYIRAWLSFPGKEWRRKQTLRTGARMQGQPWFWNLLRNKCRRRFAWCVLLGAIAGMFAAAALLNGGH